MMNAPAAGWYDDPNNPALSRYYDGVAWTANTRPNQAVPPDQLAMVAAQAHAVGSAGGGVGLPAGTYKTNPFMRLVAAFLEPILMVVTLGIGWLIWAIVSARHGQTPAKRVMGQRVISAETLQPVGFARMFFARGLLCALIVPTLIGLTLGILLFMPLWNSQNRNLWDKMSSTRVVNDPHDAWRTH